MSPLNYFFLVLSPSALARNPGDATEWL